MAAFSAEAAGIAIGEAVRLGYRGYQAYKRYAPYAAAGAAAAREGYVYGKKVVKSVIARMKRGRVEDSAMRQRVTARRLDFSGVVGAGGGVHGQRRKIKVTGGRPVGRAKLASKLAKSANTDTIVRFQNVAAYEGTGKAGAVVDIGHYINGNQTIYPVHLYDLTSAPIDCLVPATNTQPIETFRINPFWVLGTGADNNFRWTQCAGVAQSPDGTSDRKFARWFIEKSKQADDVAYSTNYNVNNTAMPWNDRMALKWSDIRIQMLGARNYPVNVDMYIVQFKDQDCDPYNNGITFKSSNGDYVGYASDLTGTLNQDLQREWNSACKAWLKPRVFNPMDVQPTDARKMFRILKHRRITFAPDSSTNLDTNRANCDVKWFQRDGRCFNFAWDNATNVNATNIDPSGGEMDDAVVQQYIESTSMKHAYVAPGARTYLMIVIDDWNRKTTTSTFGFDIGGTGSDNLTSPASTESNANNTTSYNIILRNKWVHAKL